MEAAFFDLDKTIIAKASMVAFGRPLLDAGMISRRLLVRAAWSNLVFHYMGANERRMRKLRESALRVTRGWDQALISILVEDNLTEVIEPIVYEEALELLRHHQSQGREVFIVSASPEEIVKPLARFLGVDNVIATRPEIDENRRYTGNVEFYSYGPSKAGAIHEIAERDGIDLEASFAYSDSVTDLPMLETVGHPVVVNPDRELAKVARERDWEIMVFRHGVPLRERVTLPPPRHLIAIAAALALSAAVAGSVWYLRRHPTPLPDRLSRRVKRPRLVQVEHGALVTRAIPLFTTRRASVEVVGVVRRPGASSPRKRRDRGRRGRRGASSWLR